MYLEVMYNMVFYYFILSSNSLDEDGCNVLCFVYEVVIVFYKEKKEDMVECCYFLM